MEGDNFEEMKPSINNSADSNRPIETNNGLSEIKKDSKPSTEVSKIEGSKSNIDVNKNTDTPSKIEGKISVEVQNEKFKKEQIKTIAKSAIRKHAKDIAKKSIPVVGGVLSIVDAISRYQAGDYTGMFSQIASSAIGVVPYVGTSAAVSIQGGLILRDVYKDTYGVFPENDPLFSQRKDAIVETIKEIDIPALISESLSDIVKENAPETKTETNPTPTKPQPNTVEEPKPTKETSTSAPQVAEKSTLYSMFPSLESMFGGKSNTNVSTANSSVTEKAKPNQVTEEKTPTKPNSTTVEQKPVNKSITAPSNNPPSVTKTPSNTVTENPIKLPMKPPSVSNPYPRPNPSSPIPNPVPSPIPRNPMPEPVAPKPAPIIPIPVVPPPVPAAPVPAPVPPPAPAPSPNPVPAPAPLPPITPIPIPSVPVPGPAPVPSPAPMPMPATPNKTPTKMDENPQRRRRQLELNPSDVTKIQKSVLEEPYIKTAPTLVIYPFIGGDERRIKAKTSERYNKEIRRVREINYEEQRATMEAESSDEPILEYGSEGVPNRYRMPEPRPIPPAPALGKDR